MKCPYCAEDIREEARLCRFCGASRLHGNWAPPGGLSVTRTSHPGTFTMKTAAICFGLSAFGELIQLASPWPILGAMRGGIVAYAYHLTFAALFAALAYTLFEARPSGYRLVMITTGIYTLDKANLLLDALTIGPR